MKLPEWAPTLRPHQLSAIQTILSAFNSGHQLVMLDAPTGSGKTLIGEMVRQELETRGLYLCSSLSLQHQFAKDFPDAAILYGRSNYTTYDRPREYPELSAADCNKERISIPACENCTSADDTADSLHCRWCHPVTNCPYERAKASAIRAPLCCTNSYYFLYEANFVGNIAAGRGLIVIDEADTIETILLSFVEVRISERRQREYNLPSPAKKTVASAWVEWAQVCEPIIGRYLRSPRCRGSTVTNIRNRIRTQRLLENIKRLNDPDTGIGNGGWVYTGYDKGTIAFKPVEVNDLAQQYLWSHCKRWLLMSATMISFQQMADSLGVDSYEVVS